MKHPLTLFSYCPKCGNNHFDIHDEKSKKCAACHFVYYMNSAAAVVAIITNKNGELLVCRRAKSPHKGMLDLPGGFIDVNETAEEAIVREIKEETNLQVNALHYVFSLANIYLYSGFDVHTTDLFYICKVEDIKPLHASDDVEACFFLPNDEIRVEEFGLQSIRQGIRKWLSGEIQYK